MKEYNVYHHDYVGNESINYKPGYHVTVSKEGFRAVPVTALIWSQTVVAKSKSDAILVAKAARGYKQQRFNELNQQKV